MLGIDLSDKLNNALNGLNFVKAFTTAYNSSSGLSQEKVSILHMEAFLFLMANQDMAHQDSDGIPLLSLQEALGHAQAKMQRLAASLEKIGWITLKKDLKDRRHRIVYLTEKGRTLFDQLSPCFSEEKNAFVYQAASESMKDSIAEKAAEREVLMGAKNIVAGASIVSKASMNVTVEVGGVSAKGETGDVEAASEYMNDITNRLYRAYTLRENGDELAVEQERKALEFELRAAMRSVLHGETGKVEVGADYIRTEKRGIVTHKVLLRRLWDLTAEGKINGHKYPPHMFGVVEYLRDASDADYEKMLTPTPKTKRERLEKDAAELQSEIKSLESGLRGFEAQFGMDHIFDTPHLFGAHHKLLTEVKKTQALLALTQAELAGVAAKEANTAMLKELEEMPDMTPEQEAELNKWEESRGNPLDDFDVTEFPTTGATEKE